jgi:hypothetical protein
MRNFEVLRAVHSFLGCTPYSLTDSNQRFAGTCCFHVQGTKVLERTLTSQNTSTFKTSQTYCRIQVAPATLTAHCTIFQAGPDLWRILHVRFSPPCGAKGHLSPLLTVFHTLAGSKYIKSFKQKIYRVKNVNDKYILQS